MPPEALTCGKLSERGDVWSLGILILLCISLEFDLEELENCTLKHIIETFQQVKGASLMSLAGNKNDASVNESRNLSEKEENYSVSTSKRTQK